MQLIRLLGLGNPRLGNHGVGPAFVRWYADQHELPPGIECVERGQPGFDLMRIVSESDAIVFVDALLGGPGDTPGSLRLLHPERLRGLHAGNMHTLPDSCLAQARSLARLCALESTRLLVIGIVIDDLTQAAELSLPVRASFPSVAEVIGHHLVGLGVQAPSPIRPVATGPGGEPSAGTIWPLYPPTATVTSTWRSERRRRPEGRASG